MQKKFHILLEFRKWDKLIIKINFISAMCSSVFKKKALFHLSLQTYGTNYFAARFCAKVELMFNTLDDEI